MARLTAAFLACFASSLPRRHGPSHEDCLFRFFLVLPLVPERTDHTSSAIMSCI